MKWCEPPPTDRIAAAGARLTLRGASTVSHCGASYTGGCVALYAAGATFGVGDIVEGTTIAHCTAGTGGGGLSSQPLGHLFVSDSFVANSSSIGGGGILIFGESTLSNAHISRCHAGPMSFSVGGGLFGSNFVQDSRSISTVTRGSTITQCTSAGRGGGIYMQATYSLVLEGGSDIHHCSATTGGGGVAIEKAAALRDRATVSECEASLGGGILLTSQSARLLVHQGSILGNVATGRGGGGIFAPKDSHVFLIGSRVEENAAPAGGGGGIASPGGQIWVMGGSIVRRNAAVLGGGVALHSGDYFGEGLPNGRYGRLYASGPRCLWVDVRLDFYADSMVLAGNVYAVIRDVATGAVVDERGAVTQADPVAGELAVSQHCLAPGRNYSLILASVLGGEDEWSTATARISGPLASLDGTSIDEKTAFNDRGLLATPDVDDWATRNARHHSFSLPEAMSRMSDDDDADADAALGDDVPPPQEALGDPSFYAFFAENVATEQGGAVYLGEEAKVLAMDTAFRGNVALGASDAGGVAYLDTATTFEADACVFDGNRALHGPGGAVHGTADSALCVRDSRAVNNTAHLGGGFGAFYDAKRVNIRDSVLEDNAVRGDGDGGGLEFRRTTATIVGSTLRRNRNLAPRHCGGAIAAVDSTLSLSGVVFQGNDVAEGHGGALSVSDGTTIFEEEEEEQQGATYYFPSSSSEAAHPHSSSASCSNVEVIFDYTTTEDVCGQYLESEQSLCDFVPNRCALYADDINVYVPNRTDVALCAGCACPYDGSKYFLLKDAETGQVLLEGTGHARSIRVLPTCLADGNYTIQGFDALGEEWWGASVYAFVHEEEEPHAMTTVLHHRYDIPRPWPGGFNSTVVAFAVQRKASTVASKKNKLAWNSAPNGGGGGVYWMGSADPPAGLATVLMVGNIASYGADVATEPRHLVIGTTTSSSSPPPLLEMTSGAFVDPPVKVRLLDAYNATVASDSATSIFAIPRRSNNNAAPSSSSSNSLPEGLESILGAVVVADRGVATFDTLAFVITTTTTSAVVDFNLDFTATALALASHRPAPVTVRLPPKPRERDASRLSLALRAVMVAIVLANLALVASCAAWTYRHRRRVIVDLSQPSKLYCLCVGCFVSTISSITPLVFGQDACQLTVWLYGAGFVITTATLYSKMQNMRIMIDRSLKLVKVPDRRLSQNSVAVYRVMGGGELIILTAWALVAPLDYKRSCVERVDQGVWDGACRKSVGTCRTTQGPAFVGALAVYHVCCLLAGIRMCHRVRNLPSVMAEGKWVFTGFYSQLQVYVTFVPVLAMVAENYHAVMTLRFLLICLGDATTLAMIYFPKMYLVSKYGDFSRTAIAAHIARTLAANADQDTVYDQLRVDDKVTPSGTRYHHAAAAATAMNNLRGAVAGRSQTARKGTFFSRSSSTFTSTNGAQEAKARDEHHHHHHHHHHPPRRPIVQRPMYDPVATGSHVAYSSVASANFVEHHAARSQTTTAAIDLMTLMGSSSSGVDGGGRTAVIMRSPMPSSTGTRLLPSSLIKGNWARSPPLATASSQQQQQQQQQQQGGGGLDDEDSTTSVAMQQNHHQRAVIDRTQHYLNHEIKNRLHLLADPECEVGTRLSVVDECLEIVSQNSVVLQLATGQYLARLEDLDLSAVIDFRLARYRTASHDVVREATAGTAARREGSLLLDRTLINIILDNVLSNAFKYGDGRTPPRVELTIDALGDDDDDDADAAAAKGTAVAVRLDVTNAEGPEHARLVAMGEVELNRVAATEGERAHGDHLASTSAGDGFPMSVTSAAVLGGSLWLHVREGAMTARLELPRVGVGAVAVEEAKRVARASLVRCTSDIVPLGLTNLALAVVDDSALQRMRAEKIFRAAFPASTSPHQTAASAPPVLTAGHDARSIESFARDVVTCDSDLVLTDQNFGLVHDSIVGTDLVAEIRRLDAANGSSRLIYVSSANDNPQDIQGYFDAGADGVISKSVTVDQFRRIVCERAANETRFKNRLLFTGGGCCGDEEPNDAPALFAPTHASPQRARPAPSPRPRRTSSGSLSPSKSRHLTQLKE